MIKLSADTFERPENLTDLNDPKVLYARSYLLTRMVVGGVGFLLPSLLFIIDWFFLRGRASIRGSLSAYYHTPARDLFVGALCVVGFFLITYMAGQRLNWDNLLSTIAGVAALGVAFLPTKRPNLTDKSPLCGSASEPLPGCTQLQHAFGETMVATIHFTCAAIFILSLASLCFLFGKREKKHAGDAGKARFHQVCGLVILAAVGWVAVGGLLGAKILGITPLYVGEVASVYAFALSWLAKALDLFKGLLKRLLN